MTRLPTPLRVALRVALAGGVFPALVLSALIGRRRGDELVWGPAPILNNKYWSRAVRASGWKSITLMADSYSINERSDFDLYFEDLLPKALPRFAKGVLGPYAAASYVLRRARVLHMPFSGGPLATTPLRRAEAFLLRLASVRTVVLPYGSDAYLYSQIPDAAMRHGLMQSYPGPGRAESRIRRDIEYWVENADVIAVAWNVDGLGRWDVVAANTICIDVEAVRHDDGRERHDGRSGPVRVMHAPNHRSAKGTEFILEAVARLESEGLAVETLLVEGMPNIDVLRLMQTADILVDQVVLAGYALAAIEGMASGLPVICNLDHPLHTPLFDRYSFLGECPIVSASPDSIAETLRALVVNPDLRRSLGSAGRAYAEKYHSYDTARYLFGSIYERLLGQREVDLGSLFHPLLSSYNRGGPQVVHPLREHHLPPELLGPHTGPAQPPGH